MTHPFYLVAGSASIVQHVESVLGATSVEVYARCPDQWPGRTDAVEPSQAERGEPLAILVEWDLMQSVAFGEVCARLRGSPSPVVALVPDGTSRMPALAFGADTWQILPLVRDLLQAQVLAHRRVWSAETTASVGVVSLLAGSISLDAGSGMLTRDGQSVALTPRQAGLMGCFLQNQGVLLSRDRLLAEAWGWDFDPGTNVVDVYVHYLRHVLAQFGMRGSLQTVRGRGYRFSAPADHQAMDVR